MAHIRAAIAAALLIGVCGCINVAPRPRPRAPADRASIAAAASGLVEAHNRIRRRRGLAELAVDPRLDDCAQRHAADMARRRRMSHRGSDGSTPFRRMSDAGFTFRRAAENVAAGQVGLDEVMDDWMRSPGHRRNILGAFAAIGTGHAIDADGTPYWCVTFGTPDGPGGPTPAQNVGYP